jgi:16S rRNA (cytidine1402-2'-O)-methyltransferase
VTALIVSGLPSDSFLYLGFLPRRQRERQRLLAEVAQEQRTLVAFEVPHRLRRSLADIEAVLGDRPLAVCRELTKLHEEVWRGTVSAARDHFDAVKPRGEFTLAIGGAPQVVERWDEDQVRAALDELLAQGKPRPAAARRIAAASGWSRREVYALGLKDDISVETGGANRGGQPVEGGGEEGNTQ